MFIIKPTNSSVLCMKSKGNECEEEMLLAYNGSWSCPRTKVRSLCILFSLSLSSKKATEAFLLCALGPYLLPVEKDIRALKGVRPTWL